MQFTATYPLELEGRVSRFSALPWTFFSFARQITPTQFLETINIINERLIEAHSLRHSFIDNALAYFTLQLSRFVLTSHYDKVRMYCIVRYGILELDAYHRRCDVYGSK